MMAGFKIKFGSEFKVLEGDFHSLLQAVKSCKCRKYDKDYKMWVVADIPENRQVLKQWVQMGGEERCDHYGFLYGFQKQGVRQMLQGRPLLCDEVGLGKSRMAVAYCLSKGSQKTLVVVPSALKKQWKNEIGLFSNLPILVLDGTKARRQEAISGFKSGWVIVSYEIARQDILVLKNSYYDIILLDEVHKLKNNKTKTYKSLKQLSTAHFVGITATPFVNRPTELFNIVNFILPGYFSYTDFYSKYVVFEEIWVGGQCITVPVAYKNLQGLNDELKNIMVRRKKVDVLDDLPERVFQDYYVDETKVQKELRSIIMKHKGDFSPLAIITALRLLSDGADLFMGSNCEVKVLCPLIDPKLLLENNKIDVLKELLPGIDGKVIIFTQYVKMAERIRDEVGSDCVVMVTGSSVNKDKIIQDFKVSLTQRFLVATDCLNYGVNLQFAATLVNVDLPWSPAILEQRIGRCDRIGQLSSKVHVLSLATVDTVDEYVYSLLKQKLKMFNSVVDGVGSEGDVGDILFAVKKRVFGK